VTGSGTLDPNRPLEREQMIDLIVDCFGWDRSVVERRLSRETACSGWNVVSDVLARDITPFKWSDRLAEFYGDTDAFIYELMLYNSETSRIGLRRSLIEIVDQERRGAGGRRLQVLLWGDGLGFDSLAVAEALPDVDVTYFEISDLSSRFAEFLFARAGLTRIRVIRSLSDADAGRYDVVSAIDVLEHVPDPPAWVREARGVLREGGVAVIKEAFDAIIAARPTHLRASAVRYAYRTPTLFERHGFATERFGNFPFVFRRGRRPAARLTSARLYYHLTTPVKLLLLMPRLLGRPDLEAFIRRCPPA
jgi:SAM-dependent methyltransferase